MKMPNTELFEPLIREFQGNPDIQIVHRDSLHLTDYIKASPEQLEDWVDADYLIIMDKENGKHPLNGAYSVEVQDNNLYMVWLSYPEEPIIGKENIINHLKSQI